VDGGVGLHLSYIKPHWPYIALSPMPACTAPRRALLGCSFGAGKASAQSGLCRLHGHALLPGTWRADEAREKVIPTFIWA